MAALVKSIFGGKSDKELKELQQKYDIKFEETKVDPANVFDNDFSSIIDPKWEIDRSKLERFPRNVDAFTIPIFSDQESRDIIKLTEKIQYGPCGYPKGYRSNSRIIVNDPALAKPLYERIKQIAPEFVYQNRGKQEKWEICGLNERFRYCRYITGQHFGTHCDANFRRRSDEISFYTVNIYLNDYNSEFTGGRTLFYDYLENGKYSVTNEIEPKAGLALIFNHTTERYAHCGEKLKSGVKYIMRTDIMYRRYDEKKRKREEEKMRLIKEREEKEKLKQMKDEEKDEAIKELQAKKKLLQQSQNNNNNNNDNNNADGASNSTVGDAGGDSTGVVANNNGNKEDDGDLLVETKMAGNNEDDEYNNNDNNNKDDDARMGNGHIVDERDDKMENNGDVMMDDGRNEYGDNNDNSENDEANGTGQDSEMMANGQELTNDEAPAAAAAAAVTADASGDNEATNMNEDNTYGDQDNHVQTEDNNNDNNDNKENNVENNQENNDIAANGNDNENKDENTDANVAINDDNNDNDGNADSDAGTDAAVAAVADGGAVDVEINDNHDEP